jgi:hypothetical protein
MKRWLKLASITALCLACSLPVSATVYKMEESGNHYTIEYPHVQVDDAAVAQSINDDIYTYAAQFKDAMEKGVLLDRTGADRMQYKEGAMKYQVCYEDGELVSLIIQDYRYSGGAHGMHVEHGIVYSKQTGARIPLSNFLLVTPEQLEQEAADNLYSLGGNKLDYTWKNSVKRVPADYFLSGNGTVNVLFTPYELGPYSYGTTYIKLDSDKVDYYNGINQNA